VAYKVDRLARNVADLVGFVDRVENVGATVSLSSQDFDTSTASGRLLRTILASFAEFESELKRDATSRRSTPAPSIHQADTCAAQWIPPGSRRVLLGTCPWGVHMSRPKE
jgi:Resolvase, N terminal domain